MGTAKKNFSLVFDYISWWPVSNITDVCLIMAHYSNILFGRFSSFWTELLYISEFKWHHRKFSKGFRSGNAGVKVYYFDLPIKNL